MPTDPFSQDELRRYARHFSLADVGMEGQQTLREGRVLLVGAGGLGSPAALYLAAAGVGTLGIVDDDRVELSNLQRQIVHGTPDVGRPKVESAGARLAAVNPEVELHLHQTRLTSANAMEILGDYDLVVDGSDNFPTRYLVNDACVLLGMPWVYGAVLRWEGQVALFATPEGPCYRCLFREPPPPDTVPGCAEAGVMGVLPGIIGSLQALEAVKWLLGVGRSAAGRLLRFDGLQLTLREIHPRREADCPVCGDAPTIRELVDYEWFCTTGETRPAEAAAAEASASVREDSDGVDPEGLMTRLEGTDPPLLVDVREGWEWGAGNLSGHGAIHIPLGDMETRIDQLPADRPILFYCQSGVRSARAMAVARRAGRARVSHLEGGFEGWERWRDESAKAEE